MLHILADTTASICTADNKASLLVAVEYGFSSLGFETFSLGCHKADKHHLVHNPTLCNWPGAFLSEYERQNWAEYDPVLAKLGSSDKTITWTIDDTFECPRQQSYFDFLLSSPMRSGFALPLHSRPGTISCVSVQSNAGRQFDKGLVNAVAVIANSAKLKAEVLSLCSRMSADEGLTQQQLSSTQLEILNWAAEGKSNAVIGTILDMSDRAVKYHMSEILRKLGVATRSQAISKMTLT